MQVKTIYHSALGLIRQLWHVGIIPMFLSIVFVQGLTLVTQFFVAKVLPVEAFGVVRVVEVFLSIGLVPAGLGMTSVAVKAIAEEPNAETQGHILFHMLLLTTVFSLVVCVVLQWIIPLLGFTQEVTQYLLIMVFVFMPMNQSRTAISYFMGLKQIHRVVGINILFSSIAFVLVIAGSVIAGLTGWAWGRFIGQVLFMVVILIYVRKVLHFSIDRKRLRSLASLGMLVAIAFIVDSIASSADTLYLEEMLNDSRQVGYYGLAGIVITGCLLGASAISGVAYPYFSEHNRNPREQFSIARRAMIRIVAIMLPITLAVYFFAPLLPLVIGSNYTASIELLQIMAWGLIPSAAILLIATWLMAIGHPDSSILVSLIAIVVDFGLIRLLVPNIGIRGAAIAFVITTIARMSLGVLALVWNYRNELFHLRGSE